MIPERLPSEPPGATPGEKLGKHFLGGKRTNNPCQQMAIPRENRIRDETH